MNPTVYTTIGEATTDLLKLGTVLVNSEQLAGKLAGYITRFPAARGRYSVAAGGSAWRVSSSQQVAQ